ncbi:MAG: tRNA pseudouridine(55) synthase TruB [Ignavibacteriaceae bacterium]|nr:tRNA pseudouridine(55) synthase TruB [Ignavibacteriaceae bacterium]
MISKQTITGSEIDFEGGTAVLIDKPLEWTSFRVVAEVRKLTGVKKVGHAGTLDPKATGLLIVCTGKMTKRIIEFQDLDKTYTGTIKLGESTPSMDSETEVNSVMDYSGVTLKDIIEASKDFSGNILQIPPMYSAVSFKGKKLYKLARKGKTVEREPREVTVHKFEILSYNPPFINFELKCSKGTYVRSIASDLGTKLGCGAYLSSLRRTYIGEYSSEDAFEPAEFSNYISQLIEI